MTLSHYRGAFLVFATVIVSFLLSTFSAYAYTFPSGLSSANAVTAAGTRCAGTYVGSLGGIGGTGSAPSWATLAWGYLSTGGLPNGYNAGSYCIEAQLSVVDTSSDPGGNPGGGGGEGEGESNMNFDTYGRQILAFFAVPAFAASWDVTYALYNGAATMPGSGYYSLTYTSPASAPTATLSASPSSVVAGSPGMLTWSSTNATSCTGTGFSTGGATSGSVAVSPSSTTTYEVTCTGATGSATASRTVTVTAAPACNPHDTVVGHLEYGTYNIVLENDYENQYNCCSGNVVHGGPYLDSDGGTDVVCRGPMIPLPQAGAVSVELAATPAEITRGESSTLSWSSSGAEMCVGTGFETGDDALGSLLVSPLETTTYLLACYADAADANGSGDGINVPFVMEEWWSGGTSELVWGETVHNNDFSEYDRAQGYGFEEVCAAYASEHDAWNMQIRDTERTGDAGTNLAFIQCYGVNDPTGTRARPQEEHVTNHAWQFAGGMEYTNYLRSDYSNGNQAGEFAVAVATVEVASTECSDGISNDTDGLIDLADPGCTDLTDDSEDPNPEVVAATLTAPASVAYGTSGTLGWTCTNSTSATLVPFGAVTPVGSGSRSTGILTANTNFSLTCTGPAGTDTDNKAVAVNNPTAYIEASPARVNSGRSTSLTWSAARVTSCTVTGTDGYSSGALAGPTIATGTPVSRTITTQTTFTISCDGAAASDSVIVNIIPEFEEF